ncbi:ROK family transcriptional regulator [uncultured Tessaracoccus sp.]|uniref:ROK family transcriptional regulator n=1 Tax=uncultured Tessaracoccus sp. TaxID=905023 RepID=UPI0026017750|nr:ROK family transcriptional regulator [uncultured Tessaracoccus sp.]
MDLLRQVCRRPSTAAVLELAWSREAFQADDVIAELGLTRSTALQAVDALAAVGLVVETGRETHVQGRRGRPARSFRLNGSAGVVVGIDAGGHTIHVRVTDLLGAVLAEHSMAIGAQTEVICLDTKTRRTATRRALELALQRAHVLADEVVCLALGVPAPVDARGGSPRHPEGFWKAMNADLAAHFQGDFPAVRIENDAALAAIAEAAVGQAGGIQNFVTLLAGWRLGAGVYLSGNLVRGAHGGVGEMAGLSQVQGVLGAWGLQHIAARWIRSNVEPTTLAEDHPWRQVMQGAADDEYLIAHADPGDPTTGPLLDYLADQIARVCGQLSTSYDPEMIVFCGSLAKALGAVLPLAQQRIGEFTPLPAPTLLCSTFGSQAVAVGAVEAARETAKGFVLDWALARREGDIRLGQLDGF